MGKQMSEASNKTWIEQTRNGRLPSVKDQVFRVIANNPGINTDEIRRALPAVPHQTITGQLTPLELEGAIEKIGSQKTKAPGRHHTRWQVVPFAEQANASKRAHEAAAQRRMRTLLADANYLPPSLVAELKKAVQ